MAVEEEEWDPDGPITCWCGATGDYDDLFDDDGLDDRCGGSGVLYCYCGGDQCVCHHHGQEVECEGCPDCEHDEDDPEYDPDDYF